MEGLLQLFTLLFLRGTPRDDVADSRRNYLVYMWVARCMCIAPLALWAIRADPYVFWLEVAEIVLFGCFLGRPDL